MAKSTVAYAGFGVRLLAATLDSGIMLLIYYLFTLLLLPLSLNFFGYIFLQILFFFLLNLFYDAILVHRYGATIGKMLMNVAVIDENRRNPSFWRAFGRHFAHWVAAIPFCIGYLFILWDKKKQGLHDYIVNTYVIHKPYVSTTVKRIAAVIIIMLAVVYLGFQTSYALTGMRLGLELALNPIEEDADFQEELQQRCGDYSSRMKDVCMTFYIQNEQMYNPHSSEEILPLCQQIRKSQLQANCLAMIDRCDVAPNAFSRNICERQVELQMAFTIENNNEDEQPETIITAPLEPKYS